MLSQKQIYVVFYILFGAFCFVLPFENVLKAVPNIILVQIVFLSLFLIKTTDLYTFIKQEKTYSFLALLIVLIFFVTFLKGNFDADFFVLKKLLIIIFLVPLAIPLKTVNHLITAFIVSVFIAMLISIFNIIGYIVAEQGFNFSKGNYINDVLISERLYIGFACVISLVFSLDLFKSIKGNKVIRIVLLVNILAIISFLFLITARIAIISSIFVLFYFISIQFKLKQKLILYATVILCSVLFFSLNKNLTKRFLHLDDQYSSTIIDKVKLHEPRYDIWNCGVSNIKLNSSLLVGYGYSATKELLVDCYKGINKKERKDWFVQNRFNTHNQFLDILLGSGIIAFVLFILALYFLFLRGNFSFLSVSLIGILILIMMVENIFHRQIGCYLFSFVLIIILKKKDIFKRSNGLHEK